MILAWYNLHYDIYKIIIFQLQHSFHIYQSALTVCCKQEPSLIPSVLSTYLFIDSVELWFYLFSKAHNSLLYMSMGASSSWLLCFCNLLPFFFFKHFLTFCLTRRSRLIFVPSLPSRGISHFSKESWLF